MRCAAAVSLALFFSITGWSRDIHRYAVILSDPAPISARAQGGRAAVESARARLQPVQESMKSELRGRGIRITGSAHTLLNAIFIDASPAGAEQLKSLAGVAQVAPMHLFHRSLDRAEQLINVPAAWSLLGGTTNAGAGIKIGIIDTGIQATHPAFQDASLTPPSGFPVCQVLYPGNPSDQWIDCTSSDATKGFPLCGSSCAYTNNKVIVARSYVPVLTEADAADSRPDDPSPRDRVGHGTAVAMAAAGVTSVGPADTITGVAPKAFLGSYKVFGSSDVNDFTSGDVVIQALEDAYNDGMDIVVLSLGAPALSGPLDRGKTCGLSLGQYCDPEADEVELAVTQAGMVVVAAAGNGGQTGLTSQTAFGTVSSPGDAPSAIAVAATTNSHSWGNALTVSGLASYHSRFGDGFVPAGVATGPLGDVASAGDPLACTAPPAQSLTGLIVLVARGTCTFAIKVQGIQAAGAAGVIITNNPGDDTLVSPSGLSGTTIPAVFIGYDDGAAIRAYLGTNPKATVSIDPAFSAFDVTTFNQVAPFSSHGPVTGTAALKPDIAAVGVDLYLAGQTYDPNGELYSASGFLVSQGTSFSTPQVAGVAALVKQAHPALSAIQIKSSLVNTSTQDLTENGSPASVLAVGAGKANAGFAVGNTLIVTPTNASFGVVQAATLPLTQQFQLFNSGTTPLTLSVSLSRRSTEVTAHTSIDRPNLTIAAGATGNLNLTLSGTAPAPGIYEGFVTITGTPNPVNIPYLYLVGDGIPKNLISMAGSGNSGTVGQTAGYIILQLLDQYGVPVTNSPVTVTAAGGGGSVTAVLNATDNYGIGAASMILGPSPGTNTYTAAAGGLTATFQATGIAQPAINLNGIVSAANYTANALAPGSYVSIYGTSLAPATGSYTTPFLPIALDQVTVSFDNPNLSVPGHIAFVSPGQVNVQVPWELAGQPSVQVKVSVGESSGVLFTAPVANYAPAFFELSAQTHAAAALDESNNIVTDGNPVARGHVVQLFANGLGPVSNQPASGDGAPSNPLARTPTTPIVTIGGVDAQVEFSGLTPGNAGLYQINAVVPQTGTGSQPVTVSIGGVLSTTSFLAVK